MSRGNEGPGVQRSAISESILQGSLDFREWERGELWGWGQGEGMLLWSEMQVSDW